MKNIRPLHDRVLVRRLDLKPSGLIIIPEVARPTSRYGEVVAVGAGRVLSDGSRQPMQVQPGDKIYFGRYTDWDEKQLVMIQEADIVGIATEA